MVTNEFLSLRKAIIERDFKSLNDMQKKAAEYNVSDPRKWEERLRVIPTTILIRSELYSMYEGDYGFYIILPMMIYL